jgi:hypothetical protein
MYKCECGRKFTTLKGKNYHKNFYGKKKKEKILKIIKTLKPEEAAEAIVKEFKNANI